MPPQRTPDRLDEEMFTGPPGWDRYFDEIEKAAGAYLMRKKDAQEAGRAFNETPPKPPAFPHDPFSR